MKPTPTASPDRADGIRICDPVQSPCPGCGKPLKGWQAVCSPRCRTRRWGQLQEERAARIKALVRELAQLLEEDAS